MQSLKDRHREDGEQETEVESGADEVYRNGEGLGLIFIRNFESKKVDNGEPNMRLYVMRSLKDKSPRNRRAGDGGRKE